MKDIDSDADARLAIERDLRERNNENSKDREEEDVNTIAADKFKVKKNPRSRSCEWGQLGD
jgi:hypothetical protein